jgi:hypothetical protein
MTESIGDDAAIEFTRGFYDAIVAGQPFQQAYNEGITAVRLSGLDAAQITLISR